MTTSTASLLRHLLTRSDLTRLEVASTQVDAWLAESTLAMVAQVPATAAGAEVDEVFSVADEALQTDLGTRLAAAGKPTVLLTTERIRSFLHRAANGGCEGESAAAVADEIADADLAEMLSAAIAAIDSGMVAIEQLAADEAGLASAPLEPDEVEAEAAPTETVAAEAVNDDAAEEAEEEAAADDSEWFDAGELEAAMGKLGSRAQAREQEAEFEESAEEEYATDEEPATETSASDEGGEGAALEDLVPLGDDGIEELGAIVAFHSEQLERLVDLPHAVETLTRELQQLRSAVKAGGALVTMSTESRFDGRRVCLMGIALALMCWSGLIWFGTGSATLALVSFAAANLVGCLSLQPPRRS